MDTLQCFRNGERIQCEEICDDSVFRFLFYFFGILTTGFIFIMLMRPIVTYFYKFSCCVRRNDIVENMVSSETQGTQCDLDIGMQRVVIHPDDTLQLSEID